ncbi:MAG: hypothetical protein NZM43_07950 [Saprospiraceae bacterium]|nr:hypothetical protein [Saprospiraceae bacterium]MDW8484240.1 hypothetical protein [Saprospiraceae bacterium]
MSTWTAYEVVFRLRAPLHVGWSKVGNLLLTRPYVLGRTFWGALTLRLTRMATAGAATDSSLYQQYGQQVHEQLAYTYFYPALQRGDEYVVEWPWLNEAIFRYRFIGSYVSAALSYPVQSAKEGMLHEVEFIAPHTIDEGKPVFLKGFVFEKNGSSLPWQKALQALQFGAERTYGWGAVELVRCVPTETVGWSHQDCVQTTFNLEGEKVVVQMPENGYLLAHAHAGANTVVGNIEPLVGREWRSNSARARQYAGQHLEAQGVFHTPGSLLQTEGRFYIDSFGLWRPTEVNG